MTNTEEKAPPDKKCPLCDLPRTVSDPLGNAFALGFSLALHLQFPSASVLCTPHASLMARTMVQVHDHAPAVCLGHGSTADDRDVALVVLAKSTGLTPDEVKATIRQHQAEGLGHRESLDYFRKLAQARGGDIALVDDLKATTGLVAFTAGTETPS